MLANDSPRLISWERVVISSILWCFSPMLEGLMPMWDYQFSSIQMLSLVWLFATPGTAAHQASRSITNSQSFLRLCPSSWWCHPTISSSVVPFSPFLHPFWASGSFLMSQFFALGGQSLSLLPHSFFPRVVGMTYLICELGSRNRHMHLCPILSPFFRNFLSAGSTYFITPPGCSSGVGVGVCVCVNINVFEFCLEF